MLRKTKTNIASIGVGLLAGATAFASAAWAQGNLPIGQDLALQVQPYVNVIVEIVVGIVVGLGGILYTKVTGKKLEQHDRDSLQTSLKNAASELYNKLDNVADAWTIPYNHQWMKDAYDYVVKATPDAVKNFGLGPDEIKRKVLAMLPQIPAAAADMAAIPPAPPTNWNMSTTKVPGARLTGAPM